MTTDSKKPEPHFSDLPNPFTAAQMDEMVAEVRSAYLKNKGNKQGLASFNADCMFIFAKWTARVARIYSWNLHLDCLEAVKHTLDDDAQMAAKLEELEARLSLLELRRADFENAA